MIAHLGLVLELMLGLAPALVLELVVLDLVLQLVHVAGGAGVGASTR